MDVVASILSRWLLATLIVAAFALGARGEVPLLATVGAPPPALWKQMPPGIRSPRGAQSPDETAEPFHVEFTVDAGLDARVREVLQEAGVALGHVILMDPASGELFSYVSTNPEVFPATRTYPTASLMKLVTAAAVLRHAPQVAARDCRYVGSPYQLLIAHLMPPARGNRVDSFRHAMAISNNQCFARFAVRDLGRDALLGEMQLLGLLEAPAIQHPAGRVEPIESELDLGSLGSGLSGSFITPLGAARLAAALAHGKLVHPYWIADVRDARGPLVLPKRAVPQPVWSPRLAAELRDLTLGVTENGTASRAFHDATGRRLLGEIGVAGKTGTLRGTNPDGRYQWFIGVAPADEPRLAIATIVVQEEPGDASAADVAAATLQLLFCEGDECEPTRVDQLHARALARETEVARALRGRRRKEAFARAVELAASHKVVDLDEAPRPIGGMGFDFPRHLRRHPVAGEITLLIELSRHGDVLDASIEASDLPNFNDFVLETVREWKFSPPTRNGLPIRARARLPIPIQIK